MGKIIGLTGPTGAGKSSLCKTAERLGIRVIDCDAVARAESENKEMLNELCLEFGQDILKDGALNRRLLAERAFASAERTDKMNGIMLPFICKRIESMLADDDVILDAPTLFESGLNTRCDAVIGVLAHEKIRKERILKRDNLSDGQAKSRLGAAKSDEFFKSHCDFIIYNNESEAAFLSEAEALLKQITEGK